MRLSISLLLLFALSNSFGQRFGYIDSDFILNQMEEYKKAMNELNGLTEAWQDEGLERQNQIDAMYRALASEKILLTEEMKRERLRLIQEKERELTDFQQKVFGFNGLLFLKERELVKPALDRVWEAVNKVAKENNLAIMFDKSGQAVMIYTDPRFDYTDFVLDELGLGDPDDRIRH